MPGSLGWEIQTEGRQARCSSSGILPMDMQVGALAGPKGPGNHALETEPLHDRPQWLAASPDRWHGKLKLGHGGVGPTCGPPKLNPRLGNRCLAALGPKGQTKWCGNSGHCFCFWGWLGFVCVLWKRLPWTQGVPCPAQLCNLLIKTTSMPTNLRFWSLPVGGRQMNPTLVQ